MSQQMNALQLSHEQKTNISAYEFKQLQNLNIDPERPKEAYAHVPSLQRYDDNDDLRQKFKILLQDIWDQNNE